MKIYQSINRAVTYLPMHNNYVFGQSERLYMAMDANGLILDGIVPESKLPDFVIPLEINNIQLYNY